MNNKNEIEEIIFDQEVIIYPDKENENKNYKQLESDVIELTYMIIEFNELMKQQQQNIDLIEDHVTCTIDKLNKATTDLSIAKELNEKYCFKKLLLTGILSCLCSTTVGAIFGTKMAISLFSSSMLLSYLYF